MAGFWDDINRKKAEEAEKNKAKTTRDFWSDVKEAKQSGTALPNSYKLTNAQKIAAANAIARAEAMRTERFIASERAEADRRAAKQAKIEEAIGRGDAKDKASSLNTLKFVGESFLQGLSEGWENTVEGTKANSKGMLSAMSELFDKKSISDGLVLPTLKKRTAPNAVSYSDSVKYGLEKTDTFAEEAVSSGVKNANQHLDNTVASPENIKKRAEEYYNLRDKYNADELGTAAQIFADVARSTGSNLPSQIASLVGTSALGAMLMANQGYASAYLEAKQEGASLQDAARYAAREGINQGAFELLVGQWSDGVVDVLLRKPLSKITKPAARTVVNWIIDTAGEGVEESIQSVVTTHNKTRTYDKSAKIDPSSVAYEGILGMISGGVYATLAVPGQYRVYKKDIDVVKSIVKTTERISTHEDAETVKETIEAVVEQADKIINDEKSSGDAVNSAEFVKKSSEKILDALDTYESEIIETNNNISEAIEAVADSPTDSIVENTARFVDTVADSAEPGADPIKESIKALRERIEEQQEVQRDNTVSPEEKREAKIEEAVLKEMDSVLRNQREEIETARAELPENNLKSPEESGIINTETVASGETKTENGPSLVYGTHKHTKTGENMHVLKKSANLSDEDYAKIKEEIKKIGGYYSTYLKGFVIPEDSLPSMNDVLAKIGVTVSGYNPDVVADTNIDSKTEQTVQKPAELTYPGDITAADKTKFKRLFKKWAENESVNISDMNTDKARMFASFASKLYQAGYNGARQIGNYAGLTDEELTGFPAFLQDTFYKLGEDARNGKSTENSESNKNSVFSMSKPVVNYFRKASKLIVVDLGGEKYITDGIVVIPIRTEADAQLATVLGATENAFNQHIKAILTDATNEITGAPVEATLNEKQKVYRFDTNDGGFYFDKKLFNLIDGDKLFYAKYGPAAVMKSTNADGSVRGYLIGMNIPEGAKLEYASSSETADVQAANRVADETTIADGALVKGDNIPESGIEMARDEEDYSAKHQRVIEEYANAVDGELRKFIDDSIAERGLAGENHYLTTIDADLAEQIKKAIGVDAEGFEVKIEPNRVQHIWINHGENGVENHSMANRDDIARMKYVLENPDSVVENDITKYKGTHRQPHPYLKGKSKGAKSVKIAKKVNGTYYIIEAVPDSEKRTAFIVTAYLDEKIEKTTSIADDAEASPARTAAGNDVNTLSDENQTPAPVSGRSETSIAQPAKKVNSPEAQIADFVSERLSNGLKINTADLQVVANNAYGGTQAEGVYDVKSMTDAMELGVNKYLLSHIRENEAEFNSRSAADAVDSIREINDDILAKIPTQTKRSDEQISLQQFSTPPNIAYVAAWTANIDANDMALEPSAGIGGLATFAKAFGAETVVNELSGRRLEVLKNLPFDAFYNENAEQIDNILPDNIKPTVILMNPPFSSTGGRTKNTTKNAIPHIEQALLRLEDGGRLVAVVGRGMADDTPTFKGWWDELRKTYNIRANIGINGDNYRKYGTTFDVQLVVIDKTGPQTGETITGYYDNLEEIPALLEGVRNDRTRTEKADRGAEQKPAVSRGAEVGTETVSGRARADSLGGADAVSGRSDSAGRSGNLAKPDGKRTGSDGVSGISERTEEVQPESNVRVSDDDGGRGRLDGGNTSEADTEQRSGGVASRNGGSGADEQSQRVVQSESVNEQPKVQKKTAKKAAENDDGVYAEYKTAPLTLKNVKKHPAKLVESSAMSAVSSPALTYAPRLDQKLIDSGALSDAQLENISYAGQAHEQILPNKQRKGYFIGDGTGVGKGRQLAGIIMDNWNRGRHKAIWISENKNLSEDARRDWKDLGGDPEQIIDWEKAQKKGIPSEGILFIPYSSLAGGKTKKRETTVLETLENWFGKDFDGVIVFDEAHNMGNLIPMKGARGTKKPSQKAVAGNNLQTELPNARITYASATGATNIENLSYAARLGLWGEGTSFRDVQDFVSKIGRAGIAAMELVARDMKSMGVYLARSISYDGVVYDNLQHKLTADQRKMYDGMSEGWQVVLQNFDKAMQITGSENAKDVKQRRGQVYGNMQQFYNQVLTSMTMPTVIKDIEKQLAAGKSCVIQLVNTNEAAQDRAVSDAKAEGKTDLDDLDITPRQLLVGYVENAFPVNQYEEYIDDNGNLASRLVTDSSGRPVINKQAVRLRDELIERLNEISIPEGPLDMLLNHFGADQVAEITGRSGRVLTVKDENGNEHKQYVSRDSGKSNIAETKDFQDGNKRILVFSGAGSTGRSFHADKRAKNQEHRIHYVLQPGWKAETAVQGFGRTHRSNQVSAPVFRLVSTDVMGHKRFVTSIARRLDQLGALTKGQRQTGSGVFGEKDNLESPLSAQALREFYRRLGSRRMDGLDAKSVFGKMGLDKAFYDEYGRFTLNENIASDIPKFLNRLLALPVEEQNAVFNAFEEIRDSFYQAALENGTLDMGLENVKADKIEISQDDVVYTDPATGAETRYVKAKLFTKPRVIQTVEDAQGYRDGFKGLYRMQDGSVRAAYRLADKTDEYGRVQKYYALISPNTGVQSRYNESTLGTKTEAIPKNEWESAWADELKNVPEYNESERHMITGALLPIWNRLPETNNVKAQRIVATDGSQYLGRMIDANAIDMTLRQLDVKVQKNTYTGKQIYDEIMTRGKRVTMRGLYGGTLTFEKRRVSGENRLEVSGAGVYSLVDRYPGMFAETINFQKRYFIPTGERGADILEKAINDLGGVRSVDSDDGGAYYSLGSSRGKWGKGDAKAQIPSVTELTRQASRIFGIEINTGKVGNGGAAGVFKTHAGTIRTRQYGDIPTIAHELGHWFDKKYHLTNSPYISTLTSEYELRLKSDGYTDGQIPRESVAEFFAAYMNNRETAEKKFPKFTSWLYDTVSGTDERKLMEYSGMTNAYFAADAERRADAQIHTRVKDNSAFAQAQLQLDTLIKNPSSYLGTLSRRFARRFIDDLTDLKIFGNAYDLAMFEKTADSVASGRLRTAMTDKYGNATGKSLADVLADGGINDMNRLDFDKYLIACAALDRIEAAENAKDGQKIGSLVYGDETLQNKDSIIDRIDMYERENQTFHDCAQELYEYERNLMTIAMNSGLISEDLFNKLNETFPHYVPLYRVMDSTGIDGKTNRGYANQKSPIARFKGSGRDIYSPVENIMLNTEKFTKSAMRNDVMVEFANYLDAHEDMGWAGEKVPEAKIFDVISTDSIAKRLAEFKSKKLESMSADDVSELFGEMMDFIGDYAGMWKPAAKQGRNVVSVMRNGVREYYEIHDSDLMKCLTAMDPRECGTLMKLIGSVTAKFKVLTTGSNPIFGVTNVQRDIFSGFVSSDTTNNPIKYTADYLKAWKDAITKSEDFKSYLLNGGGWSGALTQDYKHLKHAEEEVIKTTNQLKRVLTWVTRAIPELVDAGESASRYAEYKRAREQGVEALEAIRKSQEVTVNFRRGGTVVKEIDKTVPYFRASVNSMYHMVDILTRGDKKQLQSRWVKFAALNTIPALLSFAWRGISAALFDEEEEAVENAYESLSTYNKNAYWCFYVGNGQFFRTAKPKDMTVFSTVWERLVEFALLDEKDALYDLTSYVLDSISPPTARDATIFGTALSLAENKTFTGAPIVSSSQQYLDPKLQYKNDTSRVAVLLGEKLDISPMQIDFVLEDNFGYVGTLITNLLRVDGEVNLGFLNKFVVDSVYSTDVANIFYDRKDEYEKNAASYKHTRGEDPKYTLQDVYGKYKYGKMADTYSALNGLMKAEEKAETSREMKKRMNAFLASVNETDMSDLDRAVLDIADATGTDVTEIAPYVVVPETVTYQSKGVKEKFDLTFDEILEYHAESQAKLTAQYIRILNSGYSDEMMAKAMVDVKEEIRKQMRDRWEEKKFAQKYR